MPWWTGATTLTACARFWGRDQLLGWHVQAAASQAQVRNYSSALERALKPATIPTSIYSSLLKTVRAALPRTMHKYTALRSRLLAAQQPSNAEPFVQHHWDVSSAHVGGGGRNGRGGAGGRIGMRKRTTGGGGVEGGSLGGGGSLRAHLHSLLTVSCMCCRSCPSYSWVFANGIAVGPFSSGPNCPPTLCACLRPALQLAAPLFADADPVVPYDTAREAVVASVAPLGAAYQETVRAGLYEGRWVDIFPNQNKRSGAYSWGTYDTPPFILMNYQPNSRGMLTLAHEIGHSVHSALADATQPYPSAAYSIFVAGMWGGCWGLSSRFGAVAYSGTCTTAPPRPRPVDALFAAAAQGCRQRMPESVC